MGRISHHGDATGDDAAHDLHKHKNEAENDRVPQLPALRAGSRDFLLPPLAHGTLKTAAAMFMLRLARGLNKEMPQ